MAQVWKTFDDWTLTDVGQRNGILQMNGWGQDFEVAANIGASQGNYSLLRSVLIHEGNGTGTFARFRAKGKAHGRNTRVIGLITIDNASGGGIYGMGQDTGDQDNYHCRALATDSLYLQRMDNDGNVAMGATAFAYRAGYDCQLMLSFDDGGVSAVDQINNVTVGRVASTTYTGTGNCGFVDVNAVGRTMAGDWMQIYSSANAGSAISTTFDAGSSVEYNGLCADISANGGSVTFDVRASGSAAGPHTTLDAGLTMTNGAAAFTAALTYRYWQIQINFTRSNTTQNVGVTAGSVRLAEGLSSAAPPADTSPAFYGGCSGHYG